MCADHCVDLVQTGRVVRVGDGLSQVVAIEVRIGYGSAMVTSGPSSGRVRSGSEWPRGWPGGAAPEGRGASRRGGRTTGRLSGASRIPGRPPTGSTEPLRRACLAVGPPAGPTR